MTPAVSHPTCSNVSALCQHRTEVSTKAGPCDCKSCYRRGHCIQGALPKIPLVLLFLCSTPSTEPVTVESGPDHRQVFRTHHHEAAKHVSVLIPSFLTHSPSAPDEPKRFHLLTPCCLDTPHSTPLPCLISLPRAASLLLSIYSELSQSLKTIQVSHCP